MSAIEQALEMLAGCGPEFGGNELSNHGPMAAEALVALGRGDAVEGWVARYRTQLDERPPAVERIQPGGWRDALGEPERVTDWEQFFAAEMESAPWREVLERWLPRLAPGVMAGATHGLIRTSHAARSLAAEETSPERERELVSGLAYWAARYQTLPGSPHPVVARMPSEAISEVPVMPGELRDPRPANIFRSVAELDRFAPFAGAIDLAAPGADTAAFLSDLTATMAGTYLRNTGVPGIGYVHTVTAPSALRMLLPHISPETGRLAARYAWQACAAVHSRWEIPHEAALPENLPDVDDLIDQAVFSGDEHAIKFTEACLREYALRPEAAFLAGAFDLSGRFARRRREREGTNS